MPYTSTILITGGTSGLGYATAINLSKSQPNTQIVITGRTLPAGALNGFDNITYLPLDLSTHAGTRAFVEAYLAKSFPPISALLLNAGYQTIGGITYSPDNIEIMFAVNHVNHALLFFLLADNDQLEPTARIVSVSSSTHDPTFNRVPDPSFTTAENAAHHPTGSDKNTKNEAFQRYALSKLCNVFFTYALHDYARKNDKAWIVTALDPGVMATRLYREQENGFAGKALLWVLGSSITKYFMKDLFTAEFTAATLAEMAVAEGFGGASVSGKYYGADGGKEMQSSAKSHDKASQKDLWDWTITEVLKEHERAKWEL